MGRLLINIALIILLLLVTFFGMGPVLLADGTDSERIYTAVVVVFIYLLLFAIMFYVNKRRKS